MPAQWPRALLRAALREVGYDASGTRDLDGAHYQIAKEPERGPVQVIVVDQDALTEGDDERLEKIRQLAPGAGIVLLAPATRRAREGPWSRTVRRPISLAELVGVIEALSPLPSEGRRPID
jgi:hypothetical protein